MTMTRVIFGSFHIATASGKERLWQLEVLSQASGPGGIYILDKAGASPRELKPIVPYSCFKEHKCLEYAYLSTWAQPERTMALAVTSRGLLQSRSPQQPWMLPADMNAKTQGDRKIYRKLFWLLRYEATVYIQRLG